MMWVHGNSDLSLHTHQMLYRLRSGLRASRACARRAARRARAEASRALAAGWTRGGSPATIQLDSVALGTARMEYDGLVGGITHGACTGLAIRPPTASLPLSGRLA